MQRELQAAGIEARIEARPKHIFSIWRKMQAKQLAFEQLMDIRAARVLVDTVAECYAALGRGAFAVAVHSRRIRRLHRDSEGQSVPLDSHRRHRSRRRSRSRFKSAPHEMHADSERGVAAHWRYKEGGRSDQAYERKINQLRSLLAPAEGGETGARFPRPDARRSVPGPHLRRCRPRARSSMCRSAARRWISPIRCIPIWAIAPAAPRSMAAWCRSTIGSRTATRSRSSPPKTAQPSRDWLSAQSGFLASPRHRNKVRAWFRKQDEAQNKVEGRAMLDREMQRLGVNSPPMPELLSELKLRQHRGACMKPWDWAKSARARWPAPFSGCCTRARRAGAAARVRQRGRAREPEIEVQGIGDLLSTYARCCKPVPPEPIVGYITVGRGVSIHSQSCANLGAAAASSRRRACSQSPGARSGASEFPVDIEVQAFDRRGLVRDVSAALADEKISIQGMNTVTDRARQCRAHAHQHLHHRTAATVAGAGAHRAIAQRHQRQKKKIAVPRA